MAGLLLPDGQVRIPPEGLSISEAAAATGISVEALRYYEREELLLNATPRDVGGRRRYGRDEIGWLLGLVMLRETGMPIADMRVIAEVSRRPGTERERLALFEAHRLRVIADLERTRRYLAAIDTKIAAYRKGHGRGGRRVRTTNLGDGLQVSAIGFGAMGMSAFYGASDERESIATLRHAVDQGVTFIDTAEAYGPFENEKLIARALGSRREEIILATKASSETDDDGTVHGRNGTPEYIHRACDRSLRHLGTEVIDLYYLHRADPQRPGRGERGRHERARRRRQGPPHRAL